jgi:translation initiation factor IF-2
MVTSSVLDAQLQQLAWSEARYTRFTAEPAEPWNHYEPTSRDERLLGCLALLRVYTRMIKALERRTDLAVKETLALGGNYGDIGDACGISRQAARQRWLRHRELYEFPQVRLSGGPRDGERARPRPGEELIVDLWEDGPARPSGYLRYVPSEEDPGIYTFAESQTYDWNGATTGPPPSGKPRVYQIAKEFGVDSKAVMAKLNEMGEYVRTASATVEPEALRKLWEHFQAPGIQPPYGTA